MPITYNYVGAPAGATVNLQPGKYYLVLGAAMTVYVDTPEGWRRIPTSKTTEYIATEGHSRLNWAGANTVDVYDAGGDCVAVIN